MAEGGERTSQERNAIGEYLMTKATDASLKPKLAPLAKNVKLAFAQRKN